MRKYLFIGLVACIFSIGQSFAQEIINLDNDTTQSEAPERAVKVHFQSPFFNNIYQDYAHMRRSLNLLDVGYERFSASLNAGIALSYYTNRWQVMTHVGVYVNSSERRNRSDLNQQMTWIGLSVGRVLWQTENRNYTLTGGVGWQANRLQYLLFNNNSGTVAFDQVPSTAIRNISPVFIHSQGYFEIAFETCTRSRRTVSLSPTWRIGYRAGSTTKEWQARGATVTGMPSDRLQMVFLQADFTISRLLPRHR